MARILIIDDERLVCDLLKTALNHRGHDVLTASSGQQGVTLFQQRLPHFTLLDLRMPGMNGIEVLKQIRQINPEAAVMVLTAWGSDDFENQARTLGVTEFLNKGRLLENPASAMPHAVESGRHPFSGGSAVPGAPAQAGASASQPAGGGAGPPGREAARKSILVVDDESLIRNLLEQFLSLRDYRVRTASDGAMAMEMVEQEPPDFILLDMYMPRMTGIEVLRALRAKNYHGRVLVLTASQDQTLLQEARSLGSIDLLGKPVDLERLALAIQVGGVLHVPGTKESGKK